MTTRETVINDGFESFPQWILIELAGVAVVVGWVQSGNEALTCLESSSVTYVLGALIGCCQG